jgi:hypothetical protein
MPSNYFGNQTATQPPAVAPSLITPIELSIPVDGDTFNASAWLQAFKACADYIAYLQAKLVTYGVTLWDATVTYTAGIKVTSPSDGNTYRVMAGRVSNVGVDPAVDPIVWEHWGMSDTDIADALPVTTASTSTTDIAVSGNSTIADVVFSRVGKDTVVQRCSFKLTIQSTGSETITFLASKAFYSGIKNVHITGTHTLSGKATSGAGTIISSNVILIVADLGGADYFVTVEGY